MQIEGNITADAAQLPPSSLLDYLPAIYHEDPFLGQFLLAFEKILLGREDNVDLCYKGKIRVSRTDRPDICYKGLEEIIADLATVFDPQQTRADFLPWLAAWTAFTLRADLNVAQQRDFIANIVQRYQWRGTKQNLQDLLAIFTVGTPTIIEAGPEFQIGVHSTIGKDIYLGGGQPHYFQVIISLPQEFQGKPKDLARLLDIAHALIELEKPAHTFYDLAVIFPSMQIGVHSTVGVDTLLGTLSST